MNNLKEKLAVKYYEASLNENNADVKFSLLFEALVSLAQANKVNNEGKRQTIRRLIESNITAFECDVDFENEILDVFYERPVFNNLVVESDKDVYFYEDFNTNKTFNTNDDYVLSIKNFQRIVEDSEIVSFYMSIVKIYDYIFEQNKTEYSDYENRLIKASAYLLECAIKNLFEK